MRFALIFLILLSISFASSLEVGITPPKIFETGYVNEPSCTFFKLYGENISFVDGGVMFSNKNSKDIQDYTLSPGLVGLGVSFLKETSEGEKEICFLPKKKGEYYGAITYKINGTSYGIGTWINLKIDGPSQPLLLTGKAIEEIREKNLDLWFIVGLLLLTLVGLSFNFFKKR